MNFEANEVHIIAKKTWKMGLLPWSTAFRSCFLRGTNLEVEFGVRNAYESAFFQPSCPSSGKWEAVHVQSV